MQQQQRIRGADLRLTARTTVCFLGCRVGIHTEYAITHQVPVQCRRRGWLRHQLHAVRARRCARRLRERACALLPVPPRHDCLSMSNRYYCHQFSKDFSHFCLWILYYQPFHNDLKFTTDGQQNQTSHEPRSRAFYFSMNSLLHIWITYYTEPPMKVPITDHDLKNCC